MSSTGRGHNRADGVDRQSLGRGLFEHSRATYRLAAVQHGLKCEATVIPS